MDFYAVLDQVLALLRQRGRVTYRALKLQFKLNDESLEVLKDELIKAQRVAVDENGDVLVWGGEVGSTPPPTPPTPQPVQMPAAEADRTAPIESLPAAARAPEAERRHLTVLFCDLVDSAVLAGQLDPEEWREVVRAYQETCAKVIARYEGHIAQYLGDGLLVYFGYPQAHEDDAQRAVRAGLGMVEAMGQLNARLAQERAVSLEVRLGIHTGLVVVGEMGGGARQEQLALGETPNIAARLQGIAAPNTVVISAATFQLLGGFFACQSFGTPALKGIVQPLEVYQVLYESMARSRLEAAGSTGLTPLMGREQEIGLLLERWAQVKDGLGQVVLLSGEAGIGKSRLVQVLAEQVAAEPQAWLTPCQCSAYYQNTALYPIIELLERVALQFEREEPPEQKLRKLQGFVVQYGLPLAEAVPLFAALLSLPLTADYAPLTVSPERQKQQTLRALLTILLRIAARQPVLFVMEDLHWVDPTTLEFLSLLVDQGPTARILTLLTFRHDFRPPWTGRSHLTQVTLPRLPRRLAAEMTDRVAHGKSLPAEVVEQVVARTDGVPLFVEELTKMVLESGLLQERAGCYELAGPLPPLAIPTTLHDSLMARLDRLATVKGLAQLGATLGREFSYELLLAVSPWDEGTLREGLQQLVAAEFFYQQGLPPQATYRFKHALIQEAAYQSLLRSTRQQHHQRIAQVLEKRFHDLCETQPELLAHHYTQAGLTEQAVPYCEQAGEKAMARSAHREAAQWFEQALSALAHLPETHATREQAIDLRLALRSALIPLGDFGRILAYLREAEALAVALDDPRQLGRVSGFLARHLCFIGAYDQAIAAGQRALTVVRASGDRVLEALENQFLGIPHHAQGDYRRAIDAFGQTVMVLKGTRRYERFGQVNLPAVFSRAWLAWCHAELGTFAEGRTLGEEGLRIAEAVNHPHSLMRASWGIGLLALRQGDLSKALLLLERAMGLCQDADLPGLFLEMAAALGAAYTLAGRVADAVPLLTQAMAQATAPEMVGYQVLCGLSLGEAHLLAGHVEEAQTLAKGALSLARAHQERGNQAHALHLLGEIAARREPPESEQARDHYRQALALADKLGMRPLQAHCHLGLGTLHAKLGCQEAARSELSAAIELYRSMEMTFWLPQAESVLAQMEGGCPARC
jgi:class 3 adenylate cyclase/tetratricopeptide (TPR) repeat protein